MVLYALLILMRIKITMIDGSVCSSDFIGCNTIEEVRVWLNAVGPFMTIGTKVIINTQNVLYIREDVQNNA